MTVFVAVFAIVYFVQFMFFLTVENMVKALIFIVLSVVLFKVGMKLVTYEKGYNVFQAIQFYWHCRKKGFVKLETCQKKTVKFREFAEQFEFAKNMEIEDLFEMYEIAHNILYRRREK